MKKFKKIIFTLIVLVLVVTGYAFNEKIIGISKTNAEVFKLQGKQIEDKTYTIRIENNKPGHLYKAYQIFSGDLYINELGESILSNIDYGDNFKQYEEELIKEFQKIDNPQRNTSYFTSCETAEDIAEVLSHLTFEHEFLKEITVNITAFIENNSIQPTQISEHVDENYYTITNLEPGYYIVIDAEAKEEEDSYSRHLMTIVEDTNIHVKSSTPYLRKNVFENNISNDATRNTATYKELTGNKEIDYDIKFEIHSSVPNIDSYNTYQYIVTDILSKGFDIDEDSLKISANGREYAKTRLNSDNKIVDTYSYSLVKIDSENYEQYKAYFEEEGTEYSEKDKMQHYGKTILIIEFLDFAEQIRTNFVNEFEEILIEYNARLNGKGEVGSIPNINEAYLTFSSNPYHEEKIGKTKKAQTYTYTINLDIAKIAEIVSLRDDKNYLSGAEFEIYDGPEYIKNEIGTKVKNENRNLIAKISSGEEILDKNGNIIQKNGHAIYSSLGSGTYYIKEVKAPDGYNKLKQEIVLLINAVSKGYTISWETNVDNGNNFVFTSIQKEELTGEPYVELQVENTKGFALPKTGGEGTSKFIILGLYLMMTTIIISLISRRKKK